MEISIPKMKVWEKVLNCVSLRIIGPSNGRVNEPILQGGIGPQNDTSVRRSGYIGYIRFLSKLLLIIRIYISDGWALAYMYIYIYI